MQRNVNIVDNIFQIPKSIISVYSELIAGNPNSRPNPADVITRCRKNEGFFKNDLVDTLLFLEEIQIKDTTIIIVDEKKITLLKIKLKLSK